MTGELVLVTGASGYVGIYIVKLLLENGYRVRGTVRSLQNDLKVKPLRKLSQRSGFDLELVEADLTSPESWVAAVKDCIYVQHVASPFVLENPQNPDDILEPAVKGTLAVLKACGSNVKRVVLTSSSAAVNGILARETPYTEEDWCDTSDNTYVKSKVLAERAAWDYVQNKKRPEQSFDLAVINPGLILGPDLCGSVGESVSFIKRMMQREEMALYNICIPFCDLRDVAQAHLNAMTNPFASGHRHIVAPYSKFFPEIAKILKEEFDPQGYDVLTRVVPRLVVQFMGLFIGKLKHMLPTLDASLSFDCSRMRDVLHIKPRHIKDTVLDMAYSMIEAGIIYKSSGYTGPKYSEKFT